MYLTCFQQDVPWDVYPKEYYDEYPPQYDWSPLNDDVIIPPQLQDIPKWPSQQAKTKLGQVSGVAMDTDGNLVVFHRADRHWNAS